MIKGYPKKAIGPKMTLREWFDKLKITPDAETGRPDAYRSSVKKDRNGFINIYKADGYGLLHEEQSVYMDVMFTMKNNDINDAILVAAG